MLEIFSLGGYEEVGKNSTAVKYGDEIVIFDLGLHMERIINMQESGGYEKATANELIKLDAVPNINVLDKVKGKVIAIVSNHGHLDHIGAMSKLAGKFDAPIISTPFTIELIDDMMRDDRKNRHKNPLIMLKAGERMELSKNLSLEFIHTTHSIPHTVFSVLHTPDGAVLYANDYKFDNFPTLDAKPDYARLESLSDEGVKALIVETVRIERKRKTPSESVAKLMLEDVLLGRKHENGLAITTFASHIARIRTIVDISKELDRELVIMGRSMAKYLTIAQKLKLLKLPKSVQLLGYSKTMANAFSRIKKDREAYMLLCTGHQGEPNSVLDRISDNKFNFRFQPGDEIVFSSQTIPTPINHENRYRLDLKLKAQGTRIFDEVHVSGHASKEDHRDLLSILKPEHIVPCHGNLTKLAAYAELALEMNRINRDEKYRLGKTVHLMHNEQKLEIN